MATVPPTEEQIQAAAAYAVAQTPGSRLNPIDVDDEPEDDIPTDDDSDDTGYESSFIDDELDTDIEYPDRWQDAPILRKRDPLLEWE